MSQSNKKVFARIKSPEADAGKTGILDGDRFKYSSQNFWVQPIKTASGQVLALHWEEISEREYDSENYKIDPSDSKKVYDYQKALRYGRCHHCDEPLKWVLSAKKDDRFIEAVCCGVSYSMMPETVRIVAKFASPMTSEEIRQEDCDGLLVDEEDFIKALRNYP